MAYTTINKSSLNMNTKLYTGNSGTNAQTGVGFQPDWTWIKGRSTAYSSNIYDAVRGVTKIIKSNSSGVEDTQSTSLTAFGTDGFTLGSYDESNYNNATYASWNWKGGGTASANTDGSLSSSVSANQTNGFSIVTYNGRDATDTIGHGLGAEPSVILFKCRSNAGSDWYSYWKPLGNNSTIRVNNTGASSSPTGLWNTTNPTSSVFTVISSDVVNRVGRTFVAYCFAEKQGYSNFGSYVGNGNADGPMIYTGFKPAWIMIKRAIGGTDNWVMFDNKRSPFNEVNENLAANSSGATNTGIKIDMLSNGFKCRVTEGNTNVAGNTYIYMAFGQTLVGTNNIPNNAR